MIEISTWQAQGMAHAREGGVCQDAALVERFPWGVAGVVSDGCSSQKASETGAWILSRSAMVELRELESPLDLTPEEFLDRTLHRAERAAQTLGLSMADALATLSLALVDESKQKAQWIVWGDGYAGVMDLDQPRKVKVWGVSGEQNMPFYPGYLLRPEQLSRWQDQDDLIHVGWTGLELVKTKADITAGLREEMLWQSGMLFTMTSDGVASLPSKSAEEAFEVLTGLKGTQGHFLVRRMGRALKDWGQAGQVPQDDFAMIGFLEP